MNLIFYFCCGLLQVISYLTGYTYLEVSMVVNIYLQGLMCIIATVPSLFYLKHAVPSQRFVCLGNFVINSMVIGMVFLRYHNMTLDAAGNLCISDLNKLADMLEMSYIQVNLLIFIFVFLADLFISRVIFENISNHNKRVMVTF